MSWRIDVKPSAEKQYLKLDKPTRQRLKAMLHDLEVSQQPLRHASVRPLTGKLKGDYRVGVGGRRLLLTPDRTTRVLHVYATLPRGNAY